MARPRKFDETTRKALIKDTAEQILAGGVESVSLRPLAAKHGCSTTAIYTMFGSRDALIEAVVYESVESFTRSQESVPITGDPLEDLWELGRAYRQWALKYPALYVVMIGRGGKRPDISPEEFTENSPRMIAAKRAIETLFRRVAECAAHGILGNYPIEEMGNLIWASVHGWVSIEATRPVMMGQDPDEAYDRYMQSLVRAWAPSAAQA